MLRLPQQHPCPSSRPFSTGEIPDLGKVLKPLIETSMRALAVLHECMDAGTSDSFPLTHWSARPNQRSLSLRTARSNLNARCVAHPRRKNRSRLVLFLPAASPARQRPRVGPWLGLSTRIARLLYAQFHSANKIRIPTHPDDTLAFHSFLNVGALH